MQSIIIIPHFSFVRCMKLCVVQCECIVPQYKIVHSMKLSKIDFLKSKYISFFFIYLINEFFEVLWSKGTKKSSGNFKVQNKTIWFVLMFCIISKSSSCLLKLDLHCKWPNFRHVSNTSVQCSVVQCKSICHSNVFKNMEFSAVQ